MVSSLGLETGFSNLFRRERKNMYEWNVVVTIRERGFVLACEFLEEFGRTEKTEFFNILVTRVDDVHGFLEGLRRI